MAHNSEYPEDYSDTHNQEIAQLETGRYDMKPYYMARVGEDFFKASLSHQPQKLFPYTNFYLLAVSIELGLKAFLINDNNTEAADKKNHNIGHNLPKLLLAFSEAGGSLDLSEDEINSIEKLSHYFKPKSLEYGSGKLWEAMLGGMSKFPKLVVIESIAGKVTDLSRKNRYYIDSDTKDN